LLQRLWGPSPPPNSTIEAVLALLPANPDLSDFVQTIDMVVGSMTGRAVSAELTRGNLQLAQQVFAEFQNMPPCVRNNLGVDTAYFERERTLH